MGHLAVAHMATDHPVAAMGHPVAATGHLASPIAATGHTIPMVARPMVVPRQWALLAMVTSYWLPVASI